jgi:hypothetical protein
MRDLPAKRLRGVQPIRELSVVQFLAMFGPKHHESICF